ncbi:MAG: glycyl-radical enzyme activating protein [Clostridia bacterium]|nr:glycyl-radical enzyme activating protein [Clostridia bacterium]
MKTIGRILNIQHFCTDDGPGIRTTVFLKGCPLRCAWCHNPESQCPDKELLYHARHCIGCTACVSVCPTGSHTVNADGHTLDRTACVSCMRCVDACRYEALETAGREMTVDEVLADLLCDRTFYETSGGGVTLSGGEPTAQPNFAEALLRACREAGLHTAIETCAYCSPDVLLRLCSCTDLFLVDWKCENDALHSQYTGVSNALIRKNLACLCEIGARVVLRCPLIPGINLTQEHYDGIAALANAYPSIERIDLEPYHPMGIGKMVSLGRAPTYANDAFMDTTEVKRNAAALRTRVKIPVIVSGR